MNSYNKLRDKEINLTRSKIKDHQLRINWSREQIQQHQLNELKKLLFHVNEKSGYYKKLIQHNNIEISNFTLDKLKDFPVMSKEKLLNNWYEIVCDKDLNIGLANKHIERLDNPDFLLDKYHIFTSGLNQYF